jgi:cytoskeletal protein CcmA (bactofilin family)
MFRQSGNIILSEGEVFEKPEISGNLYLRGGRISESVTSLAVKGGVSVEQDTSIPGNLVCLRLSSRADLSIAGDLTVEDTITMQKGNLAVNGAIRAVTLDSSYSVRAGSVNCEKIIAGNDLIVQREIHGRTVSVGDDLRAGEIKCDEILTGSLEVGKIDCVSVRVGATASIESGKTDSLNVEGTLESSGYMEASVMTIEKNAIFNKVKCGVMNVGGSAVSRNSMEVEELKTGESLECNDINAGEIVVAGSIKSSGNVTASGDIRANDLITVKGEISCSTLEGTGEISAERIECKMNIECQTKLSVIKGAIANVIMLGRDCKVSGPIYAKQVTLSNGASAQDIYAVILHMKTGSSAANVYADEITMWKNSTIRGRCLYRHWVRDAVGMKIDDVGEKVASLPKFPS